MTELMRGFVLGLLLAIVSYFALHIFYSVEFIPFDLAGVTIRNQSQKHIKKVSLAHRYGKSIIDATELNIDE